MKKPFFIVAFLISATYLTSHSIAKEMISLTKACETALALSGGPKHIRNGAGVYVLGPKGYELVKDNKNQFICLVTRASGENMAPQCFDKIGQDAHVKVHLDEGRKLRAGVSAEQLKKERAAGFSSGKYKSPTGAGVVYMASDYNFRISADGATRVKIAPHVMYHAPYLNAEDIGSDPIGVNQNYGMPFINRVGPMGYMIAYVEHATDSSDVIELCAGQLPDPTTFTTVPAKRK